MKPVMPATGLHRFIYAGDTGFNPMIEMRICRRLAFAAVSLVLLGLVIYVPFLQPIFNTTSVGSREWGLMLPLIFLPSIAAEATKWFLRRNSPPARAKAAA